MGVSATLNLPYLEAAQAQKHVTVNDALRRLDALVQLTVVSAATTTQPASPQDGQVWIVPAGKTGAAWGAMANGALAYWRDGAWEQITPREGWIAWVLDADKALVFNGTAWADFGGGGAGTQGPQGPQGPAGPTGPAGPALTASELLALVLSVDGAGSLLDADLLDGLDATSFMQITGSQSISGVKTFTNNPLVANTDPGLSLTETDAAADNQRWRFFALGGAIRFQALTDAGAGGGNQIEIRRSGNNVTALRVGPTSNPWQIFDASGVTTTGYLKPGSPSSASTAGAGAIRWDAATAKLQVSDGTAWINLH